MKKLLILIMTVFPLFGETIMIDNFQTDIFSKNTNDLKKIKLKLVFDTDKTVPTYKLKDGLNIIISSFYIEDLFTSKAKESFKKLLIDYLKKRDNIEIKNIYIEDMQIVDKVSVEKLLKKLDELKPATKKKED
jgi:hypothetical protein